VSERLEVRVPDIGDFEDVDVIELLVAVGDEVEVEASLVTLESDKATMEIPSPAAGRVSSLRVEVGDKVSEGDVLLELEGDAAAEGAAARSDAEPAAAARAAAAAEPAPDEPAPDEPAPDEPAPDEPAPDEPAVAEPAAPAASASPRQGPAPAAPPGRAQAPAPPPPPDGAVPHASPLVRGYARELGVDLTRTAGSGPHGRIRVDDVREHVRGRLAGGAAPDAEHGDAVDLSAVEAFRARFGERFEAPPPLAAFALLAVRAARATAGEGGEPVCLLRPGPDGRLTALRPDADAGLGGIVHAFEEGPGEEGVGGDFAVLDLSAERGGARPSASALGVDRLLVLGGPRVEPRFEPAPGAAPGAEGRFVPRRVLPLCLVYNPTRTDPGEAARLLGAVARGLDRLTPLLL